MAGETTSRSGIDIDVIPHAQGPILNGAVWTTELATSQLELNDVINMGYVPKGATLIGNGPDVLTRVSMIGNDMALDSGVGTCGKEGQSVPVGVGQPTLRIDGLTVGGTA